MLKTPLKLLLAASIALPGAVLGSSANARPHHHHYYGGYYYGYSPHHGYYRHHHGHAGTYLGVALLGLGLGYVLSKSHDDRDDYYRDQRYRDEYYRDRDYRGSYATPPPPGYSGAEPQSQQPTYQGFDFSQCQETREYQTTILIDGEEQQAYGTACLMPDGTWVAGPMQIQ